MKLDHWFILKEYRDSLGLAANNQARSCVVANFFVVTYSR